MSEQAPTPTQDETVPMWAEEQTDLTRAVDAAREATQASDRHYSGLGRGETVGDRIKMGAPTVTREGHRIDARQGAADGSEQTHVYVETDPISGEVKGGGTVSGVADTGERYERRVDAEAAQHLATVIAQNVTRNANEEMARQTPQPQ